MMKYNADAVIDPEPGARSTVSADAAETLEAITRIADNENATLEARLVDLTQIQKDLFDHVKRLMRIQYERRSR